MCLRFFDDEVLRRSRWRSISIVKFCPRTLDRKASNPSKVPLRNHVGRNDG
jgi:hypothetical protein